jgi:S-adenosylmethionine:tRNA ribosyltransferase-isomerase
MQPQEISIKDYTYELPQEKIALFPVEPKHQAKLLIYKNEAIENDIVINMANYLPDNSLIIFNNSKVIPARIHITLNSGALVEIFLLEPIHPNNYELAFSEVGLVTQQWKCLIGGAKKWKQPHQSITLSDGVVVNFLLQERVEDAYYMEISWNGNINLSDILDQIGKIPLPPYIKRAIESHDSLVYQTMFANKQGSVAAPTAGLHYTEDVMLNFKSKGIESSFISLHVGAGTFKPVKSETIGAHQMHAEYFEITIDTIEKIMEAPFITIVGTTSLRTVETLYNIGCKIKNKEELQYPFVFDQWEAYSINTNYTKAEAFEALLNYAKIQRLTTLRCSTSIIITPLYRIKVANAIATNFHQPQSTLLLLVASILQNEWRVVYHHALNNDYRFLSYGDTSLLFIDN